MGDSMFFPKDPMEFISDYSFKDKDKIYTNSSELIKVFRVEQMMEHYMPRWTPVSERLPDTNYKKAIEERGEDAVYPVLATIKRKKESGDIAIVVDRAFYFRYGKLGFYDNSCSAVDVIAWMPLPEPYRPEMLREAGADAGQYADAPTLRPAT